jgi:DNA topoisomerase VI subunit B
LSAVKSRVASNQKALQFEAESEPKKPLNGAAGANGHAHASEAPEKTNGEAHDGDAAEPRGRQRRATAESMAAKQRDISVSEFFAKNRHLLGFDNPRKALLTTVKEAVDNSLDACEEAGITPEVWVAVESTGNNRFKVSVQDNGPGIVKKQIPLIFGKLLYGSKFHRLRMSRGQQGIGISAAGMYGMLTTGKPVKIISKLSPKKPAHYFELQIDTKRNQPEIINGRGEGVDIDGGKRFHEELKKHEIDWETHYPAETVGNAVAGVPEGGEGTAKSGTPQRAFPTQGAEVKSGTRVTIELEGRFIRGRGSVDEYLEQTAIANPHVTLHYKDPEGNETSYKRATTQLPPEPKEIKPHPYGIELGRLVTMLKDTDAGTMSAFLTDSFSRVSSSVARKICETAKITTRANPKRIGRQEADSLYQSIQNTRISAPATDCLVPIGEPLILKGLHQVVPGEFYCAATRPPSVYRGNPFLIEVGLAFGGVSTAQKVSLEALTEMLGETDARTLRQFLMNSFDGIGSEASDKILTEAKMGTRQSPGKLSKDEIVQLHAAMRNVNLSEGQSMQVFRYANRVPLQFQPAACAITQSVIGNNWRSYGLSQSRGNLPQGPVTVMVHMASVWVPFTSESKEAIAGYPEIHKELRLALQAVGRKLGMYLNRRQKVKQESERRSVFLRYLGEVAGAVGVIQDLDDKKTQALYEKLLHVAKRKTAEADTKLDERGKKVEAEEEEFGENVLIVEQTSELGMAE